MPFVAVVAFVMYRKVHLLLDDIVVVAAEGDKRCLQGPQMHRTPFRFSELHNNHFLHRNSHKQFGSPHKLNHENQMQAEHQKIKINLELPYIYTHARTSCYCR